MNNSPEFTDRQQQLLLQGLRYVRSSIALETRDWSEEVEAEREQRYREIADLEKAIHKSSQPIASV